MNFAKTLCSKLIIKINNSSIIGLNSDLILKIISSENPQEIIHQVNIILNKMNPEIGNIQDIIDNYIQKKFISFETKIHEFNEYNEIYFNVNNKIEKISKYIRVNILVGLEEINSLYFLIINQINSQKEQLDRLNTVELEIKEEIKNIIKSNEEKFASTNEVNIK